MADLRACPVCQVKVKTANLERHVRNRHPRDRVDLDEVLTREERRALKPGRPTVTRRGLTALAALVALLVLLSVAITLPPSSTNPAPTIAPDFTVSTSLGGSVTLSAFRGFPVLLVFLDIDCHYCEREARDVLRFTYEDYQDRVRFLSVSVNSLGDEDTPERVNEFRQRCSTPWTYGIDPAGTIGRQYDAPPTPRSYVIDREGAVVGSFRGMAPDGQSSFARLLDKALGG